MRRSMSEPRTALQPRRRVKEPASTVGHAKRPAMILRSAPASSMHSAKLVTMERATRRGSARDRKSVGQGKSVSVRVDLGGGRIIKTKKLKIHTRKER